MSERVNGADQLSVPGAPASLLMRAARRTMRALPEAAAHWAGVEALPAPYRRNAVAWFTVAQRIRSHTPDPADAAAEPLGALTLGAELLGTVADLRALAFELAGGLDAAALERLASARITQGWLNDIVGLELLLVEGTANGDLTTETQTARLLALFTEIVLGRRVGLRSLRDHISPAGWAVIVAILLQVLTVESDDLIPRPGLWPMSSPRLAQAEAALSELLKALAVSSAAHGDSDTWPWDAFVELQSQWPENVAGALRDLTDAAEVVVTLHRAWTNPRSDDSPPGRQVVRLADGSSIGLADWQVDIAHIRGEKGIGTETVNRGNRLQYIYSLAQSGERVLGLHLASRQLALAAFGTGSDSADAQQPHPSRTERVGDEAVQPIVEPASEVASATPVEDPPAAIDTAEGTGQLLQDVRAIQRKAWNARADRKGLGRHRVALLQWDVVDTYTAPGAKDGKLEGLLGSGGAPAPADDVEKGGHFASIAEHRRRAILKAALAACADFGVDGLVLPEYSIRPETVNWLARQLKQASAPIVVWCGTFRIPGGTQLDYDYGLGRAQPYRNADGTSAPAGRVRFDDHSALLTYLRVPPGSRAGDQVEFGVRRKRYPSAAAGELIRPPVNEPWHPLIPEAVNPFDVASFAIELVCSEMFPHASSANFVGIIEENEALARRYGLPPSTESPFKYLAQDIYEFAKWTSFRNVAKIPGDTEKHLWRGARLQRTLIVVPAMTTRSADYHIFGQNQYLAAGLVTVFCNAVEAHYACGESCFIGLDGWRETEPPTSPYGKVAPGIFQIGGKGHSGPLGRREAAMVIADLDLLHTTDQKPRPHYQDRPLELVAHLPLIFRTELGANGQADADPHKQRRVRVRSVPDASNPVAFDQAVAAIRNALSKEKDWRGEPGVLQLGDPPSVRYEAALAAADAALQTIELFTENSTWAADRRKAFHRDRYETPGPTPCPAMIDWIYVDDHWASMPTSSGLNDAIDPLMSDEPRLRVSKSRADPPRKADRSPKDT